VGADAVTDRDESPGAVMLLGPTASGKSALAMRLAERFPLEIVSVDSALVYRGMDIGTAKPTADERAAVPHHLLDIVDPAGSYSAAGFVADARRLVDDIARRGRLPLLVGGTMLYAKAFNDGLDDLPPADPTLRSALDAEAARVGWPALHARLAAIDPVTAARLEPGDSQRIQRALEVHAITGRPMSALVGHGAPSRPIPVIALEPTDRSVLHRRIAQRFDAMLAAGLLDEVATLRARGDLHPGLPSMRCVGYRQAWSCLAGEYDRQTMVERAVAATRQLAKRQLTWLRSMPTRRIVDCTGADPFDAVASWVQRLSRGNQS
jgi:tRNA dimethylallyltransferase